MFKRTAAFKDIICLDVIICVSAVFLRSLEMALAGVGALLREESTLAESVSLKQRLSERSLLHQVIVSNNLDATYVDCAVSLSPPPSRQRRTVFFITASGVKNPILILSAKEFIFLSIS